MKNIAIFLIDYSGMGGVEQVTNNMLKLFQKKGMPIMHMIALYKRNEEVFFNFPNNISEKHVICPDNKKDLKNAELTLTKYLAENKITDFIFQGDNMSISLMVNRACKKANTKSTLVYHGSPFAYLKRYSNIDDWKTDYTLCFRYLVTYLLYPFKKLKLKKVISTSNNFVCVSHGVLNELKGLFNFKKIDTNIIYIHNSQTFSSINSPAKKENIVTYVSRLEKRHKNSMFILKVWNLISNKYPDWRLEILGDGSLINKMQEYVQENQMNDVYFRGKVNNVNEFLAKSKITVSSSYCGGFEMGLVEAAYFANALIAPKSDGGLVDIIINEKTGFISAKGDIEAMAKNISLLIENPDKCKEIGLNAKMHIDTINDDEIFDKWRRIIC